VLCGNKYCVGIDYILSLCVCVHAAILHSIRLISQIFCLCWYCFLILHNVDVVNVTWQTIISSAEFLIVILNAILTGPCTQRLLLFDALDGSFKAIKLRQKKDNCEVCGSSPSITELIDYEQFCGTRATDKVCCWQL